MTIKDCTRDPYNAAVAITYCVAHPKSTQVEKLHRTRICVCMCVRTHTHNECLFSWQNLEMSLDNINISLLVLILNIIP